MLGLFALLKSISGVFRQVSGIFTTSLQPRFTEIIYSGKMDLAQKLFNRIRIFLVLVNSLILVTLLIIYDFLIKLVPSLGTLGFITYTIFLICAYLDIFWLIESAIIFSVNDHKIFSLIFFLSAIIGCSVGGFLAMKYGVAGMALGTLLIDLVLIPFSVKKRRGIIHDNFDEKLT
jgi:O-antigen/teichoic acid export membrane protein